MMEDPLIEKNNGLNDMSADDGGSSHDEITEEETDDLSCTKGVDTMSTSEIVKLCESLSLADEGKVIRLQEEVKREGIEDVSHCLIGKVLSGKKVNREAFISMIDQLWSPFSQVEIEAIADNIFMFFFTKTEDRDAIWKRGPWHFDNHLIVLEKPIGAGEISNLGFDKVDMWVQIHNLPLMYMNRRAARSLAAEIGQVIEIPADAKECRGKFLRVKVRIEINKPLKRFIKLAVDDTERVVVAPLIYERLPEFCYACGKLGHVLRECPDDEARIDALEGVSTQFGAWLRAHGPEIISLGSVGTNGFITPLAQHKPHDDHSGLRWRRRTNVSYSEDDQHQETHIQNDDHFPDDDSEDEEYSADDGGSFDTEENEDKVTTPLAQCKPYYDYLWGLLLRGLLLRPPRRRFNARLASHAKETPDLTIGMDFEWIFVITNIVLESMSAIFTQLSSKQKPQYALFGMLLSYFALLTCIIELIYEDRRRQQILIRWWRNTQYHDLSQRRKSFATLNNIVALACALVQCVFTTINYRFENLIKVTVLPIFLAFGVLFSKTIKYRQREAL